MEKGSIHIKIYGFCFCQEKEAMLNIIKDCAIKNERNKNVKVIYTDIHSKSCDVMMSKEENNDVCVAEVLSSEGQASFLAKEMISSMKKVHEKIVYAHVII